MPQHMDKEPLINFIQQNIPNIVADPDAIRIIADSFEPRVYKRKEFFLKEGKAGGYLFLAEGFMRAFTFDMEGNEVTTFFYPSKRVVFEVSSFFLHKPSNENIQAVTDCTGYITSIEKLNTLFHSVPEFREFGRLMLIREFVAYKQRTLAMINKSAEERYRELISTHKEIFQFASLKQIASYLGVTNTSLSRIRREFLDKA